LLEAKEMGPIDNTALLQTDDAGRGPTAEEVAFAQHAMKMSRKSGGRDFHGGIVTKPEFGKEVCKFSELLFGIMQKNQFKTDPSMMEGIWYGRDPFVESEPGCRTWDQISSGLQKEGTTFDARFEDYIHRGGEKTIVGFYPGVEVMSERAGFLFHVLRDTVETQADHEFIANGKRYWFTAKHSSPISYEKESAVRMSRANPWIWGATIVLAFAGVGIVFRSLFLPFKFIFTILFPITAVWGALVAAVQENWFECFGFKFMAHDGGIQYSTPYLCIALLFGLGMDYDIFLFTRVYEYRHEGYDNTSSVQKALVETGPTVMTAGSFMALTFFFMYMNKIHHLKHISFIYLIGVLVDTYITCTCIAPALLCWGEWLNFWPGYIPPVSKKYNVEEGCDQ
jgi:hypothetical protein